MTIPTRPTRIALIVGGLLALTISTVVTAHAELDTSVPAAGSTVESPFDGPIVLTFTEPPGDGSEAILIGPDGEEAANAELDAPDATMTFTLTEPLDPGDYEVRWTTVADDGHVERGTIEFTVAPAPPTPEPTPEPTPTPTATASAVASSPPPTAAPTPAPTPSPTVDGGATGGSSDVLIPIIVALLIVGAGGAYLLTRRNRPINP